MTKPLHEIDGLKGWLGDPPRRADQYGSVGEADSELVPLGDGRYLATNIDTVSEEIWFEFYKDPYTMGWIAATAALSDLAAVGAKATGLLFSAVFDVKWNTQQKALAARGLNDSLRANGTFLLGGDNGLGTATVLSGVGIGICDGTPVLRKGAKSGDLLCVVGQLDSAAPLALRFLRDEAAETFAEQLHRPVAKLSAGEKLRALASSAIDTSDGLFMAIDFLSATNGLTAELRIPDSLCSERATAYVAQRALPQALLWFIEHGDFQLLLTLDDKHLASARTLVPDLTVIGRLTDAAAPTITLADRTQPWPADTARALLVQHRFDPRTALKELLLLLKEGNLP